MLNTRTIKNDKSCGRVLTDELLVKKHLGHDLHFCVFCLSAAFSAIEKETRPKQVIGITTMQDDDANDSSNTK